MLLLAPKQKCGSVDDEGQSCLFLEKVSYIYIYIYPLTLACNPATVPDIVNSKKTNPLRILGAEYPRD